MMLAAMASAAVAVKPIPGIRRFRRVPIFPAEAHISVGFSSRVRVYLDRGGSGPQGGDGHARQILSEREHLCSAIQDDSCTELFSHPALQQPETSEVVTPHGLTRLHLDADNTARVVFEDRVNLVLVTVAEPWTLHLPSSLTLIYGESPCGPLLRTSRPSPVRHYA
jgi:hypothetical protein